MYKSRPGNKLNLSDEVMYNWQEECAFYMVKSKNNDVPHTQTQHYNKTIAFDAISCCII